MAILSRDELGILTCPYTGEVLAEPEERISAKALITLLHNWWRCTGKAHHVRKLNTWASSKWAAYIFTPQLPIPIVAAALYLPPLGFWLRRLEAWLYNRQFPGEVPF